MFPQGVENAAFGTQSFFRGVGRGLRFSARYYGLYGQCEKDYANIEQAIFGEAAYDFAHNSNFRNKAIDAVVDYARNNPATFGGRAFGSNAVSVLLLRGRGGPAAQFGSSLTMQSIAGIGDVRHYIEAAVKSNGQISQSEMMEAFATGNVGILNNVDIDSSCNCK